MFDIDMPFSDIMICSKPKLDKVFKMFNGTHVISIIDPFERARKPYGLRPTRHLVLYFDDIDDAGQDFAPSIRHLHHGRNWVRNLPINSKLIVHCTAGISRSTAMAYYLLLDTHNPQDALKIIYEIQPVAQPNSLMMRMIDEELKNE